MLSREVWGPRVNNFGKGTTASPAMDDLTKEYLY